MPAFFCLNQALAFPPSAVGSMSEGGVLIKPLLSCEREENVDQCSVYEGLLWLRCMQPYKQAEKRQWRSTNRIGEDVAVWRQDVLSSNEGQEGRQDLL